MSKRKKKIKLGVRFFKRKARGEQELKPPFRERHHRIYVSFRVLTTLLIVGAIMVNVLIIYLFLQAYSIKWQLPFRSPVIIERIGD